MDIDEAKLHEMYAGNHGNLKEAVDAGFSAMATAMKAHGLKVDNADNAEILVTQMFAFACKSNQMYLP